MVSFLTKVIVVQITLLKNATQFFQVQPQLNETELLSKQREYHFSYSAQVFREEF